MTRKLSSSSRDSIEDISVYYQSNQEENRSSIQQLEFVITEKILDHSIKPNSEILEIGAGAGHYTSFLAEKNHQLTVIELVPELNLKNQSHLITKKLDHLVQFLTGDAREISGQLHQQFDCILVMGPLYHLTEVDDRRDLMKNLTRCLKVGGLMMTTHLSRVGLIGYMLTRFPTWGIDSPHEAAEILTQGYLPKHPRNGQFRGYFTTPEEIRQMHTEQGLSDPQLHSQDPCIGSVDELFNRLPPEMKQSWSELLFQVSADPMALGSGRSLLAVSRKK